MYVAVCSDMLAITVYVIIQQTRLVHELPSRRYMCIYKIYVGSVQKTRSAP